MLHPCSPYWPTGLVRPLANVATLLLYAMGEGAVAVAGPHPDLVGRALPVAILMPHERGVTPDVVLRVGEPPSRRGAAMVMVLAHGTTECMLLEGHTLQPLGEGPLLAFLVGRSPEGLLRAVAALFPADGLGAEEPGMPI